MVGTSEEETLVTQMSWQYLASSWLVGVDTSMSLTHSKKQKYASIQIIFGKDQHHSGP